MGAFHSCKNDDDTIELAQIPIRVEFEIPAGLNTLQDHFFEMTNVGNPFDQVVTSLGINKDDIVRISPQSAKFQVLFDDSPLSFVQECSVKLFHDNVGRRSEAFWTNQIRFDQGSFLDLPGTLIDAADFFDQSRLNFEVQLDTREINSQFITMQMDLIFSIRGQ